MASKSRDSYLTHWCSCVREKPYFSILEHITKLLDQCELETSSAFSVGYNVTSTGNEVVISFLDSLALQDQFVVDLRSGNVESLTNVTPKYSYDHKTNCPDERRRKRDCEELRNLLNAIAALSSPS